ncbi:MAG: aminopeptidase [Chloroflexi bacterium]|nr:aminopeptidase [Chloroflexota bacterium]
MTWQSTDEGALREGARNAVLSCMRVKPGDRVFVIADRDRLRIGETLLAESRRAGAERRLVLLEDYGQRPFLALPDGFVDDVKAFGPTVTFYAAGGQPGELKFRIPMREFLVNQLRVRHGHMVGISAQLMKEGMRADYDVISAVTQRVFDKVENAKEIRFTSAKGSDFTAILDPQHLRWKACPGIYDSPGQWGNLPEGELFTSPVSANGVIVADVLGDYFSEKYGLLEYPAVFTVLDSRVIDVACVGKAVEQDLKGYLFGTENGDRVGEFAIGTNVGLTRLVGNLLQDEKFPGVHVAFGNPYPDETGANWRSDAHLDVVPTGCSIYVDGEEIMRLGNFAKGIIEGP